MVLLVSAACGGETSTSTPTSTLATSVPSTTGAPAPASVGVPPARVTIESIGVDAPVIDLGLDDAGVLEVPTDFDHTGWYEGGPAPGERGPAIIAGHVDSRSGPAVFYRLRDLQPGDEVTTTGDDGTQITWSIDRLESYTKDDLPTIDVYGLTPGPELRLITCDGEFNRGTGHYVDNLIAYAAPA